MLNEQHEHKDKLPGVKIPEDICITTDLEESSKGEGPSGAGCSVPLYEKHSPVYGSLCG